ncbi:MAG: BspA family leucine-rich repeat surface protein [Porcipelethomonas sp.]
MKQKIYKLIAVIAVFSLVISLMPVSAVNGSEDSFMETENEDSESSIADLILLKNYLIGDDGFSFSEKYDTNKDGVINIFDIIIMKRDINKKQYNVLDEGDGWYIKGSTLYVSKIYYDVKNVTGLYKYLLESPWGLSDYSDKITSVIVDGEMIYKSNEGLESVDPDIEGATTFSGGPFAHMPNLKTVTFKHLDMDKVKDMSSWFINDISLMAVDLSGINTSEIVSFENMFFNCTSLKSINLNCIDTSSAKSMSGMFYDCKSLISLNVGACSVDNVNDFSHMFDGCTSLSYADLSGWNIVNANATAMFINCTNLTGVNIGSVVYQGESNKNEVIVSCDTMFDENNSISSYKFADGWNIDYKTYLSPIAAVDHYTAGIIPLGTGSVIFQIVTYDQLIPDWHEDYIEWIYRNDYTQVLDTELVDIYLSISDDAEEMSDIELFKYLLGIIINELPDEDDELKELFDLECDLSEIYFAISGDDNKKLSDGEIIEYLLDLVFSHIPDDESQLKKIYEAVSEFAKIKDLIK